MSLRVRLTLCSHPVLHTSIGRTLMAVLLMVLSVETAALARLYNSTYWDSMACLESSASSLYNSHNNSPGRHFCVLLFTFCVICRLLWRWWLVFCCKALDSQYYNLQLSVDSFSGTRLLVIFKLFEEHLQFFCSLTNIVELDGCSGQIVRISKCVTVSKCCCCV